MAKKKRTNNDKAWSKAVKNFKSRVKYWQNKGYDIEYEIHKPEKVTKRDIEWLNKQTAKILTSGVEKSTKRLSISHFRDEYGRTREQLTKLQDELRNSIYKVLKRSEYNPPKITPEQERKQKELEELYARREQELEEEAAEQMYEQEREERYYQKEDIEPEPDYPLVTELSEKSLKQKKRTKRQIIEEIEDKVAIERGEDFTPEIIKSQTLDLSTEILHDNPDLWKEKIGRTGTRIISDLIKLGMLPSQIRAGIEAGETLSSLKKNWIEENQSLDYATTEYYINTDTGEILGADDPRIYAKDNKGRYIPDIKTGKLKIKDTMEHHIGDNMNRAMYEEIKWSNFIGSFELAHSSHFESINPTGIFEKIKEQVGVNSFLDAMSQLSSEGSNVGEVAYWYKAGALQNIEKLETILSRVEKNTGKNLSDLRDEIDEYRKQYDMGDDWINGEDRVRQQNRAMYWNRKR